MELDWSLGQILKTLDEQKLAANTLLIVTSDNGPWTNFGHHAGSAGGFREGKQTTQEGGSRVPFLVRWPGKIEAGSVKSELVTNLDLLPTIAAAAGAALPQKKIDGLNFLPLLTGKTTKSPRDVFYYYFGFGTNNLEAVRYKHWKLVLPHKAITYTRELPGANGRPGVTTQVDVPMALYNLAHDPAETYDVQKLYPDIVRRMIAIAEEAREDLGDDLTKKEGKNRRSPIYYE
jgi:arylsulfatase